MVSMPGLNREWQWKNCRCRRGPLFDRRQWRQLPRARGPIREPLSISICMVVRVELRVLSLSLSVEEGRSTFGIMAEIWAKF